MKPRIAWLMTLLVAVSLVLGACAPAAAPALAEPTAAPVQPTQATQPTEPAMSIDTELDAGYSAFLGRMDGYNALKMDPFVEMLAESPAPFVLDVRQPEELDKNGYIPGAVHIPLRELGKNLDKLPSFDTTIVSYCGSGWRCTIAMTALGGLGWEHVYSLKDNSFGGYVGAGYEVAQGMPADAPTLNEASPNPALVAVIDGALSNIPDGWGAITAEDLAAELAENADLILIDNRTMAEVEKNGSIEADNALNIPLEEFIDLKADWPADKGAPIVTYCGSGHRCTMAMTILWSYGYTNVHSLKGGFGAWTAAGFPKVGGAPDLDAAYTAFLGRMVKYNTIGLSTLNEQLAEEPPPFLLDVRQPEEVQEKGYIEGTVLIPLRDVMKNLDKLPSFDTPIVSYCGSGWRCTIAMTGLGALGWQNVTALKENGYGGWVEAGYPTVAGIPPDAPALNAASPDPAMVALLDQTFSSIPEGWGVITVDQLASELTENQDLILIDVRTAAEIADNGVIESSNLVTVPLEDFIARKADWPADKAAKIVTYCGSGHRCTMAMEILWSYGYTDVRSLKGGLGAWVAAGYPAVELMAQ